MACDCNKNNLSQNKDSKFEKLSLDNINSTKIMAGYATFTIEQLENEINSNSEIGKKLKSVEKLLDNY